MGINLGHNIVTLPIKRVCDFVTLPINTMCDFVTLLQPLYFQSPLHKYCHVIKIEFMFFELNVETSNISAASHCFSQWSSDYFYKEK